MGHIKWLEPQIALYRAHHLLGTSARLALEPMLNIDARRHDAHMLGDQHVRDGRICWRPHKTLRTTNKLLRVKILPVPSATSFARIQRGTRQEIGRERQKSRDEDPDPPTNPPGQPVSVSRSELQVHQDLPNSARAHESRKPCGRHGTPHKFRTVPWCRALLQ
jgi:hypothetical protein